MGSRAINFSLACLLCLLLAGQSRLLGQENFRVVFYNVENLFDTQDDPLKNDNQFLPNSQYRWDNFRFYKKLSNIYKAIAAAGGWEMPAIIGLCEVENLFCLKQLVLRTPLSKLEYEIIHYESADTRGIDAAMLYDPSRFRLLRSYPINVDLGKNIYTRDILYACGIAGSDTLHLFINHWPSRWGGAAKSEWKRLAASAALKKHTDSLLSINPASMILAMGDFNDGIKNKSLAKLYTAYDGKAAPYSRLEICDGSAPGTLKFRGRWYTFDLFLATNLLQPLVINGCMNIAAADFLLTGDTKNLGKMPYRTYSGPNYLGGFSDHLPVYLDLRIGGRK
jgi:hypothetical protein